MIHLLTQIIFRILSTSEADVPHYQVLWKQ